MARKIVYQLAKTLYNLPALPALVFHLKLLYLVSVLNNFN